MIVIQVIQEAAKINDSRCDSSVSFRSNFFVEGAKFRAKDDSDVRNLNRFL